MSEVDFDKYGMGDLVKFAQELNAVSVPDPNAVPKYEFLSGSLIWSDELESTRRIGASQALAQLFHYRTFLMLGKAPPDNPVWLRCLELFPSWIGFLAERRTATPELRAAYRCGNISANWCFRKFEREMEDGSS
jgi:hypothetical protein